MKLPLISITGQEKGAQELPPQFAENIRADIIKRAVDVIETNLRQPYGAYSEAGLRHSAEVSRRRRDYRGSYGAGISRVPRKILSRRGTRFNWVGAVAPGTVGGRRAHPPKSEKIRCKEMNSKERKRAIRSAIAATIVPTLVANRGHVVPSNYPFVVESSVEQIAKTSQLMTALESMGFAQEIERTNYSKIRAGKAKARNRKYAKKTGLLLVTSIHSVPVAKAIANIPGFDVVSVDSLNAKILAPGGYPGRLTVFTQDALKKMDEKKLFFVNDSHPTQENSSSKKSEKSKSVKSSAQKSVKLKQASKVSKK